MPVSRGTLLGITALTILGMTVGTGTHGIMIRGIIHHGTTAGTIPGTTAATGTGDPTTITAGAATTAATTVAGMEAVCIMVAYMFPILAGAATIIPGPMGRTSAVTVVARRAHGVGLALATVVAHAHQ